MDNDEKYNQGVRDGLRGDGWDDTIQGMCREGSIYDKGYSYGREHRNDLHQETSSSSFFGNTSHEKQDESSSTSSGSSSHSSGSGSYYSGSSSHSSNPSILIIGFLILIGFVIIFGVVIPDVITTLNYASPNPYLATIGSYGRGGHGFFYSPTSVAVDPSGNIYVDDMGNNIFQKLSPDGNVINQWENWNSFTYGNVLATDPSGNLYSMSIWTLQGAIIKKYSPEGKLLSTWKTDEGAIDLTSDTSGNIYTIHNGIETQIRVHGKYYPYETVHHNEIKIFSTDGIEKSHWNVDNKLSQIAVDSTHNFVYGINSEKAIKTIEKYSIDGKYLGTWGKTGLKIGSFSYPIDIATDTNGNVYVLDTTRIQKFSSDGTFLGIWQSGKTSSQKFKDPVALTVDTFGNIYVVDQNGNCIHKLSQQLPANA